MILGLVIIKVFVFPSYKVSKYGNRLDGINEVKIDNNKKNSISKNITSDGIAKKANVRISGRIIEVTIIVNDEASVDSSKNLAKKITEKLNDKEEKYYDIQVFVNKNGKSTNFPIIGYKHHAKENFSWTKNR